MSIVAAVGDRLSVYQQRAFAMALDQRVGDLIGD
jgi:hypothetical protein